MSLTRPQQVGSFPVYGEVTGKRSGGFWPLLLTCRRSSPSDLSRDASDVRPDMDLTPEGPSTGRLRSAWVRLYGGG